MVAYKSQNIVKNSPFFSFLEYSRQDVFTTFLTPFTRIWTKLRTLETLVYRDSLHVGNLILHLFAACVLLKRAQTKIPVTYLITGI